MSEIRTEPPVEIPKTIDGISIHLSYMRRDLDSISRKLDSLAGFYVERQEFDEHLKADEDHEARIRNLETYRDNLSGRLWSVGALAGVLTGILTTLFNHFWK